MNLIKNIRLAKLLQIAGYILKNVQKEIKEDLSKMQFGEDLYYEFGNEGYSEFFKKNFFTLLMISLLVKLNIPNEKIKSHGKIIMYLRQIITSTDNIIDNEEKGIIKIKKINNIIVKNNLLTLICQDKLTKETYLISDGDSGLSTKILEEIYGIALSESLRDKNLYEKYPSSEYILEKIHNGIGGKLLEISLIPCKYLELTDELNKYLEGLYTIGMSLQAIDDLFDVEEDIENGKINLALAKYIEDNPEVTPSNFIKLDEEFIRCFLAGVVEKAYKGFDILREGGYPITQKDSKFLLKKLFKLRGLEEYVYIIK